MRSGALRNRITFLSPVSTARSTDGAPVVTFSTIYHAWADIRTVSAKENFRNDMRWATTDKIFTIRYTTVALKEKDIIVLDSENYEIQSIVNMNERDITIEIVGRKTT